VAVTNPTLNSISLTPTSVSLPVGLTQKVTATGHYSDGSDVDISDFVWWTSADTTVATVSNSFGSHGIVTAVAIGATIVDATMNGISAQAAVTVGTATLTSVTLSGSAATLPKGETRSLTATGHFSDSTTVDLTTSATWASTDPSVATVSDTSGSKGSLTGVGTSGSTDITATYGGVVGQLTITAEPAALISIALNAPSSTTMPKGTSQALTATGTYTDGTTVDVTTSATWSSNNTAVATVGDSSGTKGVVTSTGTSGTASISATLSGVSQQITITGAPAALVSVAVSGSGSSTMPVGMTQNLTATGTYTDGTTADLTTSATWASTDTSVATVSDTSGSKGLVTSVGSGNANISATIAGVAGQQAITGVPATLVSISVLGSSPTLPQGLTQVLTAIGSYTDGTTVDLTSVANWATTNSLAVSIGNSGMSKGIATGLGLGGADITASVGGTQSTPVTITGVPATLSSIAVTPSNDSVAKGLTVQYMATGTYSNGTTADLTSVVTWASDLTSVATISNTSGSRGLASAMGIGTAHISATLGSVTGQATLTVTAPTLVSIALTPANSSINILGTVQFTATGTYTDGSTANITTSVTWASSNPVTATISNTAGSQGRASGIGLGTTTISATAAGGVVATTQLSGVL
jgi:uncharacterized protein YjdB